MYRDVEGTERAVFDCVFLLAYRRGVRVFLGSSRNSIVALSIMCWECILCTRVQASWAIVSVGL